MPMKIETPADSEAVGEDQDVVLKGVVVDPHIIITNPSIEIAYAPNQNKGKKPMQKHDNDNACNRCGLTGHWSRTCRTQHTKALSGALSSIHQRQREKG